LTNDFVDKFPPLDFEIRDLRSIIFPVAASRLYLKDMFW